MTDYDDEDYDVSNGVLNDYLNEINCDLEQEPRFETDKIKTETEQFKTDHVPPDRFNNILSYLFFDSNHLTQYFNSNMSRSVIDSDKKSLIEIFLFISNSLTNSIDINEVKNQLSLNKIPLFMILFSCFIFNVHFSIYFLLPCLFLGIFLALFKSYLSLNDLIVSKTADLALDCLQTSNNIIYYLKEVQLVSMANKRRLLIESKTNLDETEIDLINYPFRKLVFKHFRKQFYELKHLNMQQLGLIRPELLHIDTLTFICSINNKELAEVLQPHNDYDLNQLSDYFSLSCLKSILKLIQFLISENFKLNQINKVYMIVSMNSLLETVIKSTRNILILVTVRNSLIKYNSGLIDLFNICQMIKQSDCQLEQNFEQVKSKNELEHILLNYIRNALLNCYHLKNIPDEKLAEKKKIAEKLKYDFEYCDLYFKKIQNKLEPKNTELKTEHPIAVSNTIDQLTITDNNLPIDPVVYEDEIYEADIIDNAHSNRMESSEDFEILLKDKEKSLTNKNLFYELKFALRSKKNEWTEREKKAKRINDDRNTLTVKYLEEKQVDDFFFFQNLTSHLLENDALKHKSIIKRRKRFTTEVTNKQQDKLDELIETIDLEELKLKASSANSFLSEFMTKRNKFINSDEDEIVYE